MATQEEMHYMVGKLVGMVEAVQQDVAEIKQNIIPDGTNRVEKLENNVTELAVWKRSTQLLVASIVGSVGWVSAKLDLLGSFFNG